MCRSAATFRARVASSTGNLLRPAVKKPKLNSRNFWKSVWACWPNIPMTAPSISSAPIGAIWTPSEDRLVISLDTAMKGTELSDFSVATVWLVRKDNCYLIDLWRERANYPNLKRAVLGLVAKYPAASLLIEDKGSGTSLITDCRPKNR